MTNMIVLTSRATRRRASWLRDAALTLTLAVATLAPAWAADPKASRLYEDALQRFERQDYAGSIIQLKNALQLDSSLLPVHVLLGKSLLASGALPAAQAAFSEALRLGVDRGEVVLPLARSMVGQGKQKEVIDQPRFQSAGLPSRTQTLLLLLKAAAQTDLGDARSALRYVEDARSIDPGSIDVWLAEVPIRIRARQFKEAIAAVDRARAINPNAAEVHYQMASTMHVQGNSAAAMSSYDKALSLDPGHIEARIARAGLHADSRQLEAASKDINRLLETAPLEPRGWYLSALLAEREGRWPAAKTSLRRVTELLDPVPIEYLRYRPQILLLNGQAHFGLGEREKAKPYFELFQQAQPASPVSKLLASILMAEGNHDSAIDLLDQYLRTSPGDSQAMALLASANMAKGRHGRAASLIQQALREKDSPELHTAYGLSLMGTGQSAVAVTHLEKAYRSDPEQTQAAFALVGLYLQLGQTGKAVDMAGALTRKQPSNPSLQNLLGLARAQAKDISGARKAFEEAIRLDPTLLTPSLNLARLEGAARNPERALALLSDVLKADDRNTEAMYELAALAKRRSSYDEALRWLQKAYDVAGAKDLRSSLALVDLHMQSGRVDDALRVGRDLAISLPDNLQVLVAYARAQLRSADLVGARTSLSTASRVAGFDPVSQVEVAVLQLAARNLPGAAYSLDKAISAKPDYLPAQVMMTDVEIRQGELAKAEVRAQQLLKREPKQAIGHSLLGDIATARKQGAQALAAYRKAYQLQPSSDTLGRLFRTLLAQSDAKSALSLAEQWIKAHPNDTGTRRMLAEAHVLNGNMEGAKQEYERLLQRLPKDATVLNDLANVLFKLKDTKALPTAEAALAVDPTNPATIDTVGWLALHAGQVDRAVQLLRDARLRSPGNSEIRFHLATALARMGRGAEARTELDDALRDAGPFDGRSEAEQLLRTLK